MFVLFVSPNKCIVNPGLKTKLLEQLMHFVYLLESTSFTVTSLHRMFSVRTGQSGSGS